MKLSLVTGGAGFIGSHIVHALIERGERVRVLDNFSSGRRENLTGLDVEIIEGDLRDALAVEQAVSGVDVVYHQAAFVSVAQSMIEPQVCFEINVQGTQLLFDAARRAGVKRVTVASSAAVYGENDRMPLEEESATSSISPYAASKKMDEILADVYSRALDLPVTVLRYFNVFGPRQRPDSDYAAAVPIFARRMLNGQPVTIYGDGGQTRDLVYVGDVARANIVAAAHPDAAGQVFNVCTGRETSINDLVNSLHELIPGVPAPSYAPPRRGDIYRSVGSPQKAASLLGFTAQTSLLNGLKATVEWMRHA